MRIFTSRGATAALGCACLFLIRAALAAPEAAQTVWTTAAALMPQWGFYPNTTAFGGTKPLGGSACFSYGGVQPVTWVAELESPGEYHVWLRQYGGHSALNAVTVDEAALTRGRGGAGGGKYAWRHAGSARLGAGRHHVDVVAHGEMLDAILLTASAGFNPERDALPPPVPAAEVRIQAFRAYRGDAHLEAGVAGKTLKSGSTWRCLRNRLLRRAEPRFAVGAIAPDETVRYDWVPATNAVLSRLEMWGAANQYVNGSFGLRALDGIEALSVTLPSLTGPGGRQITVEDLDLKVVCEREKMASIFWWPAVRTALPELLLRDNRTGLPPKGCQGGFGGGACTVAIPAHQSRQIWLTAHVPAGFPPGLYRGQIRLDFGSAARLLPVELEVKSVDLKDVEGYYGIYYPVQAAHTNQGNYVTPQRFLAELKDMVRHGLNTVTVYGGAGDLQLVRESGMREAPCIMGWPGGEAQRQVQEAREMGFSGLLYYGVDEPRGEAQIERCRKEGERRLKAGLGMMAAINSPGVYDALKDVIDHPVLIIYHFYGKGNAAVAAAREKGFTPISYWMSNGSAPLWHRAFAGLYTTACGFLGTAPWSYTDHADPARKYDANTAGHQVTYPDEQGDPIATVQWEAYRAGIDDVRYLQALERALAAGRKRLKEGQAPAGLAEAVAHGETVRKTRFESIDGRYIEYLCRLQTATLAETRRAFADAIVQIKRCL